MASQRRGTSNHTGGHWSGLRYPHLVKGVYTMTTVSMLICDVLQGPLNYSERRATLWALAETETFMMFWQSGASVRRRTADSARALWPPWPEKKIDCHRNLSSQSQRTTKHLTKHISEFEQDSRREASLNPEIMAKWRLLYCHRPVLYIPSSIL